MGVNGASKWGGRAPEPALVPLYKLWPSKNRFMCGGRLMTGPKEDDNFRIVTLGLICIPMALFMWGAGADLYVEVKPLFVTLCLLFGLTLVFLFLTSYTDPGIEPRRPGGQQENGQSLRRRVVDGVSVTEMWCWTCKIYRPPGTSHCKDCDNCVNDWDHHCPVRALAPRVPCAQRLPSRAPHSCRAGCELTRRPLGAPRARARRGGCQFVGNCIGRRNYGFFTAFITCISLCAALMGASCIVVTAGGEWGERFSPSRIATMAVAAVMLFTLLVSVVRAGVGGARARVRDAQLGARSVRGPWDVEKAGRALASGTPWAALPHARACALPRRLCDRRPLPAPCDAQVLGCFTCFHVALICSNVTTKEWCKANERKNLVRKNRVYRVLCACFEPSKLELSKPVPNPRAHTVDGGYTELL